MSIEIEPAVRIEADVVRDALTRRGQWSVRLIWPRQVGLSRPGTHETILRTDGEAWQALLALARTDHEPRTPSSAPNMKGHADTPLG